MTRKLIVSLHDVAPPYESEIRAQLAALASAGVPRCVLKVVPNWHGEYPLIRSQSLSTLLRDQVEGGSEIVLHGMEHRPRGALRGPTVDRLRAVVFAPGAAEFMTLPFEQAAAAVRDGLTMLADAGLPRPRGFCAPGWLLNRDGRRAVAGADLPYITGMLSVEETATGRRKYLPACGYMGGSAAQEYGISILNRIMLDAAGRAAGVLKVYLHPQGAAEAPALRRVLNRVARLVEDGWVPTTYSEWYQSDES